MWSPQSPSLDHSPAFHSLPPSPQKSETRLSQRQAELKAIAEWSVRKAAILAQEDLQDSPPGRRVSFNFAGTEVVEWAEESPQEECGTISQLTEPSRGMLLSAVLCAALRPVARAVRHVQDACSDSPTAATLPLAAVDFGVGAHLVANR